MGKNTRTKKAVEETGQSVGRVVRVEPLTAARWNDLETLFGPRGACGGCWCMYPRLLRPEFEAGKGDGNKQALRALVRKGIVPGLLGYTADDGPIAWIAVAPRSEYRRMEKSRILAPVDDRDDVWSVSCLFVDRRYRKAGVSVTMIRAAADFVAGRGGRMVEGYPHDTGEKQATPAFIWTGTASAFAQAGFTECVRRSPSRPIMRLSISAAGTKRRGKEA